MIIALSCGSPARVPPPVPSMNAHNDRHESTDNPAMAYGSMANPMFDRPSAMSMPSTMHTMQSDMEEFQARIKREIDLWSRVAKAANIKPE